MNAVEIEAAISELALEPFDAAKLPFVQIFLPNSKIHASFLELGIIFWNLASPTLYETLP
jgi:hypothetical protein